MALAHILKRQDCNPAVEQDCPFGPGSDYSDDFWFSNTGYAVRYGITAGIVVLVLLYFVGGYMHGKARLQKGLQPLVYHRWMFRSHRRYSSYNNNYNYAPQAQQRPMYGANGMGRSYEMNPGVWRPAANDAAPPPPAYNADIPPAYVPPPGATKVAPQQNVNEMGNDQHQGSSADVERPGEVYSGRAPEYR